jgi:hypothetical protein
MRAWQTAKVKSISAVIASVIDAIQNFYLDAIDGMQKFATFRFF